MLVEDPAPYHNNPQRWEELGLTCSSGVSAFPNILIYVTAPVTFHGMRLCSWCALQKHCQLFNFFDLVCQSHDMWAQEKGQG